MSTMNNLPHYEFRRFLETTDMRLQDIAEAAGVSHTTVYRWKIGRSKPSEGHMESVVKLIEKKHRDRAEQLRQMREKLDREPVRA